MPTQPEPTNMTDNEKWVADSDKRNALLSAREELRAWLADLEALRPYQGYSGFLDEAWKVAFEHARLAARAYVNMVRALESGSPEGET